MAQLFRDLNVLLREKKDKKGQKKDKIEQKKDKKSNKGFIVGKWLGKGGIKSIISRDYWKKEELKAFKAKWVNPIYILYGVNSLRLEGLKL